MRKDEWIPSDKAAAYIGVSRGQLYNLVYRRQLRAGKLGRNLRFKRSDLDRVIESAKYGGASNGI